MNKKLITIFYKNYFNKLYLKIIIYFYLDIINKHVEMVG